MPSLRAAATLLVAVLHSSDAASAHPNKPAMVATASQCSSWVLGLGAGRSARVSSVPWGQAMTAALSLWISTQRAERLLRGSPIQLLVGWSSQWLSSGWDQVEVALPGSSSTADCMVSRGPSSTAGR